MTPVMRAAGHCEILHRHGPRLPRHWSHRNIWVAKVDDLQRQSLSLEVQTHHERIVELEETLQELEANLKQVVDAPEELRVKAERLRMELKGRYAAFSVGTAHLTAYRFS
jgi:predicted  nucleic acid-binding Zn-ribbon protein